MPLDVVTPVTLPLLFRSTALPLDRTVLVPPLGSGCVPGWLFIRLAFDVAPLPFGPAPPGLPLVELFVRPAPAYLLPVADVFPLPLEFAPEFPPAAFGVTGRIVVGFGATGRTVVGLGVVRPFGIPAVLIRLFVLVFVRFVPGAPPVVLLLVAVDVLVRFPLGAPPVAVRLVVLGAPPGWPAGAPLGFPAFPRPPPRCCAGAGCCAGAAWGAGALFGGGAGALLFWADAIGGRRMSSGIRANGRKNRISD